MHPALEVVRAATAGTPFEGDLWLVGGAVRDELLGRPLKNDFDLVTRGSSAQLAQLLYERGVSTIPPVTYERFGTAMLRVESSQVELITARKESYDPDSRKPNVEAATLEQDALRRDFTVNALMRNLHSGEVFDPLGRGLADLETQILRTPLDPIATLHDDPLRMLRAVRFRWQLEFTPADGLYAAIAKTADRLKIISAERIRDEFLKMIVLPRGPEALNDLMELGLIEQFAPEFVAMVGVEQGSYHHLDVWHHTLLVLKNAATNDLVLALGALFHDIGKPPTRFVDAEGNTRFFGHEAVGALMTQDVMRRLKFPQRDIDEVARLVKNHMRLGSAPQFSPSAARRLIRDLDGEVDRLLALVEADSASLRPGVKKLNLQPIRDRLAQVQQVTPANTLVSPLTGQQIMDALGIGPGPQVGAWKHFLTEKVLEGELAPDDQIGALKFLTDSVKH